MCDIRKYPELYVKAEWILRVMKMSKEMPGYDLLQRAIVVWKVEGEELIRKAEEQIPEPDMEGARKHFLEQELVRRVEEVASMQISKNRLINNQRNAVEQAMIETIRAVSNDGVKISILEFVMDVTHHIF